MKLIVENDNSRVASIIRNTAGANEDRYHPLKLKGIFIVAEKMNRNKRKYSFEELKPEVDRFIEEDIAKHLAFGDFEHPADGKVDRERAAVTIDKLELDPDNLLWNGEARVMYTDEKHNKKGTPKGDLLKSFLDYDAPCGFSTRGVGNIIGDYVRDYKLITIDAVMDPSIGIFCDGVLESKEFMIDTHGLIVECAIKDYEKAVEESTHTYDLNKKRLILSAAMDKFLKKI